MSGLTARLSSAPLNRQAARNRRDLEKLLRRLSLAAASQESRRREKIASLGRILQGLGYEETLLRGYAVVRSGDQVITTRDMAATADALELQFHDGRLLVRGGTDPSSTSGPPSGSATDTAASLTRPSKSAGRRPSKPEQGSLF